MNSCILLTGTGWPAEVGDYFRFALARVGRLAHGSGSMAALHLTPDRVDVNRRGIEGQPWRTMRGAAA